MSVDDANAQVVDRIFAGLDAEAALPGLERAIADWRRTSCCTRAASSPGRSRPSAGLPCARILITAWTEQRLLPFVAPATARLRSQLRLPSDPLLRRWAEAC